MSSTICLNFSVCAVATIAYSTNSRSPSTFMCAAPRTTSASSWNVAPGDPQPRFTKLKAGAFALRLFLVLDPALNTDHSAVVVKPKCLILRHSSQRRCVQTARLSCTGPASGKNCSDTTVLAELLRHAAAACYSSPRSPSVSPKHGSSSVPSASA